MDLFVANPTKQDHDFIFLMAESRERWKKQPIPQGGQICLKGLSSEDVNETISFHRRYGARTLSEAKSRERSYLTLIYSTEKEITFDGISAAAQHNVVKLNETGTELRKAAAVAADQSVLDTTPVGDELKASHVEVVEIRPKDDPNGTPTINSQIEVRPKPGAADRRGKATPQSVRRKAVAHG